MNSLPLPERILVSESPWVRPGATVMKIVEETWQAELARRPSLFNGRIFAVNYLLGRQVTGSFVEYCFLLAQLRRPELYGELRISPLAVTGVLRAEGGIVWGRRHSDSTQYPGIWELLPSGGVDDVFCRADGAPDLGRQLLRELKEETGLDEACVEAGPLCFVHQLDDHEYNYVMELRTRLTLSEILHARTVLARPEHSEVALVAPGREEEFIAGQPRPLAGMTRLILSHVRSAAP